MSYDLAEVKALKAIGGKYGAPSQSPLTESEGKFGLSRLAVRVGGEDQYLLWRAAEQAFAVGD